MCHFFKGETKSKIHLEINPPEKKVITYEPGQKTINIKLKLDYQCECTLNERSFGSHTKIQIDDDKSHCFVIICNRILSKSATFKILLIDFYRFGPGAGAASAGLLAVMPRSKSMVRRVIAISGSPLADWAVINDKFR